MVLAMPIAVALAVVLLIVARRRRGNPKRTMAHNAALHEALARASDAARDEHRGLDIGGDPGVG
jgi:hypothetical protein